GVGDGGGCVSRGVFLQDENVAGASQEIAQQTARADGKLRVQNAVAGVKQSIRSIVLYGPSRCAEQTRPAKPAEIIRLGDQVAELAVPRWRDKCSEEPRFVCFRGVLRLRSGFVFAGRLAFQEVVTRAARDPGVMRDVAVNPPCAGR